MHKEYIETNLMFKMMVVFCTNFVNVKMFDFGKHPKDFLIQENTQIELQCTS